MKYEYEYKNTNTKEGFILLVLSKYNYTKRQTIRRRYYKLKVVYGKQDNKQDIIEKKIKYKKEYLTTSSKQSFVNAILENNINIKEETAKRRYYDLKKIFGVQTEQYEEKLKQKPHKIKMLWLDDMRRYNKKITKKYLSQNNFLELELNWLEDEGLIE